MKRLLLSIFLMSFPVFVEAAANARVADTPAAALEILRSFVKAVGQESDSAIQGRQVNMIIEIMQQSFGFAADPSFKSAAYKLVKPLVEDARFTPQFEAATVYGRPLAERIREDFLYSTCPAPAPSPVSAGARPAPSSAAGRIPAVDRDTVMGSMASPTRKHAVAYELINETNAASIFEQLRGLVEGAKRAPDTEQARTRVADVIALLRGSFIHEAVDVRFKGRAARDIQPLLKDFQAQFDAEMIDGTSLMTYLNRSEQELQKIETEVRRTAEEVRPVAVGQQPSRSWTSFILSRTTVMSFAVLAAGALFAWKHWGHRYMRQVAIVMASR